MAYFTEANTEGFNRAQLEIINVAYDEAWGALKGRAQREDLTIDADRVRQSLGDAINNAWHSEIGSEALAERALRAMGENPVRSIYSLEIE